MWYVVGGLAALVLVAILGGHPKAKAAPAPKAPVGPQDWSGCGSPPVWCKPAPKYACGAHVKVDAPEFTSGQAYVVTGRTWSPIPDDPQGLGLWIYDFQGSKGMTEEANVSPLTP